MHAPFGAGGGTAALTGSCWEQRCVPEQQKSCQISVDSGENVSRQSDRQADGGQLQLQLRLCLISKAGQEEGVGREEGSGGNRLAIN